MSSTLYLASWSNPQYAMAIVDGPRLGSFSLDGLRWAKCERVRLQNLYELSKLSPSGKFCQYCDAFYRNEFSDDVLPHQPGYAALLESAKACTFCYVLLLTLEPSLKRFVDVEVKDEESPDSSIDSLLPETLTDKIEIKTFRKASQDTVIRRCWVSWCRKPGFTFNGDLFANGRLGVEKCKKSQFG